MIRATKIDPLKLVMRVAAINTCGNV